MFVDYNMLLQPGLSRYSEASVRKPADESSQVIDSIDNMVSFKHSRPVDRFDSNDMPDIEFVVQSL